MTSAIASHLLVHTSSFPSSSSLPLFPLWIDSTGALSTPRGDARFPFRGRKSIGVTTRRSTPNRSNGSSRDTGTDGDPNPPKDEESEDLGVRVALSLLRAYKREISPLLPSSCRFVPTCSEYSMEAYKKYGVTKGTVLTAWRLCRCNPLGGSGFDPPRWFDEKDPSEE